MLFLKMVMVSLRSQMQYPASFLMVATGHFIGTFIDIIGIWALFDRFKMVKGWTLPEVGLIYGIIHMGFALAEGFSRGFDTFSLMLKNGDFDQLLLRPLSPLFQVAVREVHAMRIGRFFQGLIILLWSSSVLSISPVSAHTFVIFSSIVGTACVFYGLFVIQATISFWTIETLELMNIATYGGLHAGQYPITIFGQAIRIAFTFIIPIACVAYYPIATILRHETIPIWVGTALPLAGLVFLFLACQFWRLGVRHYRSTGS